MAIFEQMSIWLIFLITFGFAFLSTEFGYQLGLWHYRRNPESDKDAATGALVGGLLGLLAFMLAFTTSFALNQFQTRKSLVVLDANAIGTAYLRTDYLEEPDRTEAQDLLREYVDLRLMAVDTSRIPELLPRVEEIQSQVWAIAAENGRENPDSVVIGLFGQAVNDMLDAHTTRFVFTSGNRVPPIMWLMLYGLAFVAFLLTGVASSTDKKRNLIATILFTLGFAMVLALIIDLNRSQQGLLTVGQQALIDLQRQIGGVR